MPEMKKFRLELAAVSGSLMQQITVIEHCVDNFVHGGFYGVRTVDGKTYRFNISQIVFLVEVPEIDA